MQCRCGGKARRRAKRESKEGWGLRAAAYEGRHYRYAQLLFLSKLKHGSNDCSNRSSSIHTLISPISPSSSAVAAAAAASTTPQSFPSPPARVWRQQQQQHPHLNLPHLPQLKCGGNSSSSIHNTLISPISPSSSMAPMTAAVIASFILHLIYYY